MDVKSCLGDYAAVKAAAARQQSSVALEARTATIVAAQVDNEPSTPDFVVVKTWDGGDANPQHTVIYTDRVEKYQGLPTHILTVDDFCPASPFSRGSEPSHEIARVDVGRAQMLEHTLNGEDWNIAQARIHPPTVDAVSPDLETLKKKYGVATRTPY